MSDFSTDLDTADVDDTAAATKLDTAPVERDDLGTGQRVGRMPAASVWAQLRWAWYLLTSMRTALILLFLLALAAVPGSVLPQTGSNPLRVRNFYAKHPHLAPFIKSIGGFDVFGSPWFAAVYLLLFVSLAGCVIPRSRRHFRAMRARPPSAPRNLARLPLFTTWTTTSDAESVVAATHTLLRDKRFRTDRTESSVAAEKGHLRETGNLLFHLSLLVVLVGVAVSADFGFTGTVLVKEHEGFSDTAIAYDSLKAGALVDKAKLPPFSFTLNSFDATYERSGATRGAADSFDARVTWQPNLSARPRDYDITVNHPLSSGGANIYLVGHGYAPHFRVTDATGQVFDQVTPFLPNDSNFDSQGVVKLPDAKPQQLGISGFFLPTAVNDANGRPLSVFPAPDNPIVVIGVFAGDLGLDDGVPRSVYTLDTTKMTTLDTAELGVGQTLVLPNGAGSVTFVGFDQWATFQISRDPGKGVVLVAVAAMVLGLVLSLRVRRRRLWVRATSQPTADPAGAGRTVVEIGGLTRTDASGGFDDEFARLVTELQQHYPVVDPEGLAVDVNIGLARLSNDLIAGGIATYSLAFLGYAIDTAFGNHLPGVRVSTREAADVREAVLVGAPGSHDRPVDAVAAQAPSVGAGDRYSFVSSRVGKVSVALTVVGWLLHLGAIVSRGAAVHRLPWGNMYEFTLALAFTAVTAFLVIMARQPARYLGVFVMAPVVFALGIAVLVLYVAPAPLVPALHSYWLAIHVTAAIVASGVFTVATAATFMFLVADRYAVAQAAGRPVRLSALARILPSPEVLDRTAYRAYAFAFPIWTFAVIAGAIWAEYAWGHYWQWDPKETWAFITWVIYAGYLHARATAGWRGRNAAYIALLGFVTILFNFFVVNIFITGVHSYAGV